MFAAVLTVKAVDDVGSADRTAARRLDDVHFPAAGLDSPLKQRIYEVTI